MKTIFCLLMLMITHIHMGFEPKIHNQYVSSEYKEFLKAYKHIRNWEGNYSNLEYDAGGETYAGITRTFNKDWAGWDILDNQKDSIKIEWNTYVPELEEHVINYYYKKWLDEFFHKIKNPIVAAYLFDYRNTGIIAIKHTQQILIEHGYLVNVNYKMDMRTVEAINKMNPTILLLELKEVRKNYYYRVTERKPELEIYLKGWVNRAESIIS